MPMSPAIKLCKIHTACTASFWIIVVIRIYSWGLFVFFACFHCGYAPLGGIFYSIFILSPISYKIRLHLGSLHAVKIITTHIAIKDEVYYGVYESELSDKPYLPNIKRPQNTNPTMHLPHNIGKCPARSILYCRRKHWRRH